jgi:hypothetical protein
MNKFTPQDSTTAMQPHFDVLFGNLEDIGCFGPAQLFNIPQHEHDPILLREPHQHFLENTPYFSLRGEGFRVGRTCGRFHEKVFPVSFQVIQLIEPISASNPRQCLVHRNAGEPR